MAYFLDLIFLFMVQSEHSSGSGGILLPNRWQFDMVHTVGKADPFEFLKKNSILMQVDQQRETRRR